MMEWQKKLWGSCTRDTNIHEYFVFFKADKERKRKTSHHNLDLLEDVNSFCLKWLSERLIDDANMKNDLFTSMLNMLMRPLSQ